MSYYRCFFGFAIFCASLALAASPEKNSSPKKETGAISVAVERLKALEREIRLRADEASEEVRKMEVEAKEIRESAEAKAAKIRAEAEAYVKAIEEEIRQIQSRAPAREKLIPSRDEMVKAMGELADPLLTCWQMNLKVAALETCLVARFREKLQPYIASVFPESQSKCTFQCPTQREAK